MKRKKIAIIFFGLTRNLKKTFLSIKYNVFQPLQDCMIDFDIYLHTYYLASITNTRSHEDQIPLDNEEWKLLRPHHFLIDQQDEVDTFLPHEQFCKYKNPWPEDPSRNSMRNLLRALYSLKRAWSLLQQQPEYDGYLILRPDLMYTSPLQIDFTLPIRGRVIYLPDWGTVRSGDNDRLCLTSRDGAQIYMNRYDDIILYGRLFTPNSHRFLHWVLNKNNMQRHVLHLTGVRVRAFEPLYTDSLESFNVMGLYYKALKDYAKKK